MHQFSERSEKPTVTEVLAAVNADNDLPNLSKTTMKRLLEDMGLKHLLRGRLPPKGHKTLADGTTPPTTKKPKAAGGANANRVGTNAGATVAAGTGGATGAAGTGGTTGAAGAHNSFADSHRKWQVPETYSARPSYSNASHYSDYQLPHQWTGGQNFSLRNEAHQNSL